MLASVAPPLKFTQRRFLAIAVTGLMLLFGVLIADENHQISKHQYGGFGTIYAASSALRDGINPYARTPGLYSYVYPPLYALLGTPLLRFSLQGAARWMMVLDAAFILLAMFLLSRVMLFRLAGSKSLTGAFIVALSASLIIVNPIRNELRGLESNAAVFLCFILALYWIDRHPVLAGLSLAVAINIKYLPLAILPYLLIRRRWAAATATVAWTIGLALLPAFAIGWTRNLHYLRVATSGLVHLTGAGSGTSEMANVPVLTQSTSLSITSGLARLGSANGWPALVATALTLFIALLWAGAVLWMYRHRRLPSFRWPRAQAQRARPFQGLVAIEWAGLIATILALGPNTQDRLLLLAGIPAAVAATLTWYSKPRGGARTVAVGITLLTLGSLLPIAALGRPFAGAWRSAGMPGWFVLIGSGLVVWTALSNLRWANSEPPAERLPVDGVLLAAS